MYGDEITKVSRASSSNTSETEDTGFDAKIPKERYISPEKRQYIIEELGLI